MADNTLSPEETNTLTILPLLVGIAVAVAGKSSLIGFLHEMRVVEHIPELADGFAADGLIHIALRERDHYSLTVTPQLVIVKEKGDDTKHKYTPDRLHTHVLELCGDARNILTHYPDQAEVIDYKRWVMAVADAVAHAATEGGIFGAGKKREAEHEREMVEQVASVLGISLA